MLSFISTLSRSLRICRPSSAAQPFVWLVRSTYSTSQHDPAQEAAHQQSLADEVAAKKAAKAAYARQRWATDPEYRQKQIECMKRYKRSPATRWKTLKYCKEYNEGRRESVIQRVRESRRTNLVLRRSNALQEIIDKGSRWTKEGWTWRTHAPAPSSDRVEHCCTSCEKLRYRKLWWKEHNSDQYMCNSCFANHFDLVVPENVMGKMPLLFTSPTHPPPPPDLDEHKSEEEGRTNQEKKESNGEDKTTG
ncbi:hypothetical protein M438DRAFT_280717 [Aureobasidium pullulans EXF-150]|uniref:Uncharacterized protein n=1 Tax=Aureobasidium pullulans EXF-150 TaxID=1043002 RepID=A0A074XAN2_AURPU|nr:uncharacterized protein M438DRAFT_280717 [Aureobasidium pullulans EXF-150]KEQ80789.1 hypothetical protein M438DRAFT_280717 [Aureobasidium pullulans EXF-150]